MKRTIVFSKNAEKGLSELFEYLEDQWSERIKNKFISNLDKVIYLIQIEPEFFPKSELNKNYRKCVLSKQTTIYYKFNTKRVEIVTFFDTRQNPNKIKKDIK
ncbi:type II toxin-antitoxin system RelE/ParE family toxin [Flavobacterium sp. HTF]|uniref:type II toxin-antitoxin system RelE/ParE family toxin n=1 Tax=Flavobacterium sp. HTF TaxID=2170732 RepID=UPI000D5F1529|nr:type II toxin-antitoxin system RelE/ParE family toxin [Flavobacterium sp. HTF]PWB24936.1 type II toxin-antitoxin system RelE/ParE family toxin [Flavobacterium sp. HTF]